MITITGIVESVIGGFILLFLFWVAGHVWKSDLLFPKKLKIYAFITIVSFFTIAGFFFSFTPFLRAEWLLGTVILVLLLLRYGFNASQFSLRGLKQIILYLKGYRFSPLTWPEIFEWYGGVDNFIGKDDFHIPYVEIFRNDEDLYEENFPAKIEHEENGHRKSYNLSAHLHSDIIKDVLTFHAVQGRCWDGPTGRLSRIDNTSKSEVILHFEETTYYDYLVSNLYIDTYVPSLSTTIREHLEPNGYKDAWEIPLPANHAGVTALLLCSDKKLILLQNRADNATSPNLICGSTSGTLELRDLATGSKPSPPFEALRREMDEELHLPKDDLEVLRLLAITRDMSRGGIPEFIFFAATGLSSIEVRDRFSRAYRTNNVKPLEIKSIQQKGFIPHDIHLHFSRNIKDQKYSLPAMAAVYYYERMVLPSL